MQTFVTRFSWSRTATDLDDRRCGNQRNEALQILKTLTGLSDAYENHPVMRMWTGYEFALGVYGMLMCHEWNWHRRYMDQQFWGFKRIIEELREADRDAAFELPPWARDADLCRSHRSNLVRKLPEHYGAIFPSQTPEWPYLWPFIDHNHEDGYKLMLSKADKVRIKDGERSLPNEVMERVANR